MVSPARGGGGCSGGDDVLRRVLVRIGGMAGVAAGAAMYMAGVADLILAPEAARWPGPVVLDSSSDYLVQALLVLGLAGTLVAVSGLLGASRRSACGRDRGWGFAVGSSAAFLGHALLLYSALATIARWDALNPLAWGYLLALVGAVVLGTAVLDGRVMPRWCGLLLVLGYPLAALPWGSWAGKWMLLGSVWAAVGYALLLKGRNVPTFAAVPRASHRRNRSEGVQTGVRRSQRPSRGQSAPWRRRRGP